MDDAIALRIARIYAAIGASEEANLNTLKANVVRTDRVNAIWQDFRRGMSDEELSNQAHTVIHNIANLSNHLRRWAAQNGHDNTSVDEVVNGSFELQLILDLSNNDKHGYPPRNRGHSRRAPRLTGITRAMRLQTKSHERSMIVMKMGPSGTPTLIGDGTAKVIVTAQVVDNTGNQIGDLHEIVSKSLEAWEQLLSDVGLLA